MADSLYSDIPDLAAQEEAIRRRQAIAEAMRQQAMQPINNPIEQRTRTPVPIQWSQGLAQLLEAYLGRKGLQRAEKDLGELATKKQEGTAAAIEEYTSRKRGEVYPGSTLPIAKIGQPAEQVGTEDIVAREPDPRGAAVNALMNQFSPPGLKQVAAFDMQASEAEKNRAAEREFRASEAAANRQARRDDLAARLQDSRLSAQERLDLQRQLGEMHDDTVRRGQDLAADARDQRKNLSPAQKGVVSQKLLLIQAAKKQLELVKQRQQEAEGISSGGIWGVESLIPTERGKLLDGAIDSMRNIVTTLTRTPGIGANSDFETRLQQSQLPSRSDREAVQRQKIQSMQELLDGLEHGYGALADPAEEKSAPESGAAPGPASPPKRVKVDAEGNVIGN